MFVERGGYPWIVIFVLAVEALRAGALTGGGLEESDCFKVAVEEAVEGGEAETLLTTDETTERSTAL